jgi:S1-C subfamily serine protease
MPAMQTVRVQTPGCAVARCELGNDRGSWQLARTPGSVAVLVSGEPLRVRCHADDASAAGTSAGSSRPATSGVGGTVGGVVGGTAVGVALGSTALAFIPPLGVIAVLTGAVAGGVAGNVVESRSQPLRYPELISLPMACPAAGDQPTPSDARPQALGLSIRGLTRTEAQALGLGERTAVLVLAVVAEGPAAASGLRSGDAVLSLDGQDLGDAADLEERVLTLPPDAPLALRVWRDLRIVDIVLIRAPKGRP